MFLNVTAMYLLDLHRTFEEDRRREIRDAHRREALRAGGARGGDSHRFFRVPRRDRTGRGGDESAELQGRQDLHPAAGTE